MGAKIIKTVMQNARIAIKNFTYPNIAYLYTYANIQSSYNFTQRKIFNCRTTAITRHTYSLKLSTHIAIYQHIRYTFAQMATSIRRLYIHHHFYREVYPQ